MNTAIKTGENKSAHNVYICGRSRVELSAIEDVISFDESSVVLGSALGIISIEGQGLHILKMNVESGDIVIDGKINSLLYIDKTPRKNGLFSKK